MEVPHNAESDAGAFERAASNEDMLLCVVAEAGSHIEHFAAWFDDKGRKVHHADVGGIQCTCGWAHGPERGSRPWQQFTAHKLQEHLLVLARVTSPEEAAR